MNEGLNSTLRGATSVMSNEQILQRARCNFTTSTEQRVNFNEQRATSEKLHFKENKKKRKFLW